jgi:dihydropteroate synthase
MYSLKFRNRSLPLDRPLVMGILNVTPDSFSDGGCYSSLSVAVAHARKMLDSGAAIIDVGGESTRPGAADVGQDEELARIVPVVRALAADTDAIISVDTSKPAVMRAAVEAGASMINDVRALQEPGALHAVAELGVPVCLMHMLGEPRSMQVEPHYERVFDEVRDFLIQRAQECEKAGIKRENIVLDPGFGFGKTLAHNLWLLRNIEGFTNHGYPLLVGMSRKRMIAAVTGAPVDQRLAGSLAVAVMAAERGAHIFRVHDVKPTVDALAMVAAVADVEPC